MDNAEKQHIITKTRAQIEHLTSVANMLELAHRNHYSTEFIHSISALVLLEGLQVKLHILHDQIKEWNTSVAPPKQQLKIDYGEEAVNGANAE